jgi:hypothetical protein
MATYVLPDNRLTDEQRKHYFYGLVPDDAVEITAHVMENFPAVYDEAVEATGRVHVLAALKAKERTA